jgi:hypothetical protein
VAEILRYRNDAAEKRCELRLDTGERLVVEFVMEDDAPRLAVRRLPDIEGGRVETLWEIEWAAENLATVRAFFGEPSARRSAGLPALDAAVETLSACPSLLQVRRLLSRTVKVPREEP